MKMNLIFGTDLHGRLKMILVQRYACFFMLLMTKINMFDKKMIVFLDLISIHASFLSLPKIYGIRH